MTSLKWRSRCPAEITNMPLRPGLKWRPMSNKFVKRRHLLRTWIDYLSTDLIQVRSLLISVSFNRSKILLPAKFSPLTPRFAKTVGKIDFHYFYMRIISTSFLMKIMSQVLITYNMFAMKHRNWGKYCCVSPKLHFQHHRQSQKERTIHYVVYILMH